MGCGLFYGVLGNYALNLELTGQVPILDMVKDGNAAAAVIVTIETVGPGKVMLVLFCLMSATFVASATDREVMRRSIRRPIFLWKLPPR